MDISNKQQELIAILSDFLTGTGSVNELNRFVWEVIGYFSSHPSDIGQAGKDSEKVFWYVIWQLQHLALEDTIEENMRRELLSSLQYLKGEKELPINYVGTRP